MSNPKLILADLDRYEGAPNHYRRELAEIKVTKNKKTVSIKTWIYIFNGPVKERSRIKSGDWILAERDKRHF